MNERQPFTDTTYTKAMPQQSPVFVDGITTFRTEDVKSHVGAPDYEGPPAPLGQELGAALLPFAVILIGMYFANKHYKRNRFP